MDVNPYESTATTGRVTSWRLPIVIGFIVGWGGAFLLGYITCFVYEGLESRRKLNEYADETATQLRELSKDR